MTDRDRQMLAWGFALGCNATATLITALQGQLRGTALFAAAFALVAYGLRNWLALTQEPHRDPR